MTILIVLCWIAVAILAVAAFFLVRWNWSEDMWPRLLSATGVGLVTLVVTILGSLKSTTDETKFTTDVLVSPSPNTFLLLKPDPEKATDPRYRRLEALLSTTHDIMPMPTNDAELHAYLGELIQHRILTELRDLQREGTSITVVVGLAETPVQSRRAHIRLPDQVAVGPGQIDGYERNRFSQSRSEVFNWEIMDGIRVPEGTRVRLVSDFQGSPKYHVILEKDGFFSLDFVAELLFGGRGELPTGITTVEDQRPILRKYVFDISTISKFERITAGNWRTEHYRRWATWLISELEARNRER